MVSTKFLCILVLMFASVIMAEESADAGGARIARRISAGADNEPAFSKGEMAIDAGPLRIERSANPGPPKGHDY